MLVSIKDLKNYVSLDGLTPEEIAHALTFSGVEVEEINHLASGTNLIIGEILECEKHPDSDHLHILKVNLGDKYGVEQIVCGAPNARKGLKVIVARVGAKLPDGEIKSGVIRGVPSNGMCCSLLELGVDSKYLTEEQTKGIEELPMNALVGEEDVLGYLWLDDTILNLNVLANRPDLLSIYNVAREVGAILNREITIPTPKEIVNFETGLKVGSETSSCTQFSAKEVKNIVTKPSPLWMSKVLMSLGVRSINNIVDIGNYVMLMTGQPLHMYDADKLAKKELIARDDYEGSFIALDEKDYKIINKDIVITCDKKPMCLGGVMGSLECAVDEHTKNVYIESASFDGSTIRHTSNRLGLVSESSQRFVKGTNHFQADDVLNFATSLLFELADAESASNIVTYQSETKKDIRVESSVKYINGRLGTDFTKEEIKNVLERLHFGIEEKDDNAFTATVPAWRLDVSSGADLSEEVIRLLGFSNVKSCLPNLDTRVGALSLAQSRLNTIRDFLISKNVDECLTYSLVSKKEAKKFNLLNEDEQYVILNPLTEDRMVFRSHILHSLLKVATYNVARQNKNLALFETANVQTKKEITKHISIVLVGNEETKGQMTKIPYDFYHMKGLVENIFFLLGIDASRVKIEKLTNHHDEMHPGKSATIAFQNQIIGVFGEIHPNQISEYDLGKTNVVVLEMNLTPVLNAKVSVEKMTPICRFPIVQRDLAFVVNDDIMVRDILRSIKKIGSGLVSDAVIFDVYSGKGIEEGKKSLAISVTYKSENHTLSDKEVTMMEDKIKFELTKTYHAELRG